MLFKPKRTVFKDNIVEVVNIRKIHIMINETEYIKRACSISIIREQFVRKIYV